MSDASIERASVLVVDYCGEEISLEPGRTLTIGRDADLVVDDNPFLHRRIVELRHDRGFWWVANVGSRLSITVTGGAGTLQSHIAPGSCLPVVLPELAVLFTAGETTYEVQVRCGLPAFAPPALASDSSGEMTLGSVTLTASQFRLLLALSEHMLRRAGTGPSELPSNARAAERLDWPITTFNRKLDNVCDKFAQAGVKGLRGGRGRHATQRRVRLVEYAVAAQIVRAEHLPLLENENPS